MYPTNDEMKDIISRATDEIIIQGVLSSTTKHELITMGILIQNLEEPVLPGEMVS